MTNGKRIVVHKFGGTSVLKEPPTILKIILDSFAAGESPVVVLSALAGVTNLLEKVFADRHNRKAVAGHFRAIKQLHHEWLRELGLDETLLDEPLAAMRIRFGSACDEAKSFAEIRDAILSLGEPLSVEGFVAYFNKETVLLGIGDAVSVDTSGIIPLWVTNRFGSASPLDVEKNIELRARLCGITGQSGVPIVTGFIGRTGSRRRSKIATVGRGGSDLSACYLGALLEAVEVRIWSDVPGMLSADPRVVGEEHALPLPSLPFRHAMEMAGGGGKLHPRALVYAAKAGVPVRMLSTFKPKEPGTLITNDCELPSGMVGVVQLKNVTLINVFDPMMSEAEGFVANITRILARHGIVIGLMSTGEVELTMTVTDPSQRLEEALDEIHAEMDIDPQVTSGLSLVTIVHTGIDAATEERISGCMRRIGVEPLAKSLGFSKIALQLPVLAVQADQVVRALHEELLKAA